LGLADAKKASSNLIVDGIWEKVVSKKDGKVYDNIQKCTDISQLDDGLSNLLQEKMEEALANGSLTDEASKDYMKGFVYKHTDGWEYQVVDKGTTWQVTRKKPFEKSAGGGWKKGGGTFTHMRIAQVKVGGIEDLTVILANQADNDSWSIDREYPMSGEKGPVKYIFVNKKQYTPTAATTTTTTEKKTDTDDEETE
jgi:hypothetical protein